MPVVGAEATRAHPVLRNAVLPSTTGTLSLVNLLANSRPKGRPPGFANRRNEKPGGRHTEDSALYPNKGTPVVRVGFAAVQRIELERGDNNQSWVRGVNMRHLSLLSGIGLIVAALGIGLAYADRVNWDTADRVMPGCRELVARNTGNAFNRGQCLGLAKILFEYASNICPPDEIQNDQIVGAIVQYIDSDPARLKENFNVMAIEAMRKAWPCKR